MKTLVLALCAVAMTGCFGPRLNVVPPPPDIRASQNNVWLAKIHELGRDGDWLVIRGYKEADDFIVAATQMPLSHAAILDLENEEVIESIASGVKIARLDYFVDHAHRVLLIRPKWSNEETAPEAVKRSREVVGKKYDYLGLIGANSKKRFYCSELAMYAYYPSHEEKDHIPKLIEPGQMYLFGTILFDSGSRD